MLGEEVVDGLAEQRLEGGVAVGGEAPELAADRGGEVGGDTRLARARGRERGARPARRQLGVRNGPGVAWSRIARRRSVERAIAGLGAGRRQAGQCADGGSDRGGLRRHSAARVVLGGASPSGSRVVDGGALVQVRGGDRDAEVDQQRAHLPLPGPRGGAAFSTQSTKVREATAATRLRVPAMTSTTRRGPIQAPRPHHPFD